MADLGPFVRWRLLLRSLLGGFLAAHRPAFQGDPVRTVP